MSRHRLSGYGVPPEPTAPLVVYGRYSSASDTQEIWGVPAAGGSPQQITVQSSSGNYDTNPDINSSGTQIVFLRETPTTTTRLRVINVDGSGDTSIDANNGCRAPQFSPDGSKIIYNINNLNFFTINPDGTGKTTVTPSVGSSPSNANQLVRPTWNHDGTLVAFQVSRTSGFPEEIWVMNPDGTSPVKIATLTNTVFPGFAFSWMHGANTIAYVKGTGQKDVRKVNSDGTGDASISDGGIATDPGGGETVLDVAMTRYAWPSDDSEVFAIQKLTGGFDQWGAWSLQPDASADVALAAPLDDLQQTNGSGLPYVFSDRIYSVTASGNMVSTDLTGGDSRTEDGDNNVDLYLEFQSQSTGAL